MLVEITKELRKLSLSASNSSYVYKASENLQNLHACYDERRNHLIISFQVTRLP